MRFGLLGPLEVRTERSEVPVGGAKQRTLLVILLLRANEVVSRDRLFEELWPDRPPGEATVSLDHQISRLRRTLGDPALIVTRLGGYELHVEPSDLDVHEFEEALDTGRQASSAGNPHVALAELNRGLALWRGPALANVADTPFMRIEASRLEELRLTALEERADAELALGRHHRLVAELDALVAQYPLRERMRAQLMLALYRSGRQTEALRVYADARRTFVGELGLEPGPELRQLEQGILQHDPALAAPQRRRPDRRRWITAAVALALASAAAVAGVLLATGGTTSAHGETADQLDEIAFVSAKTGKVLGRTEGLNAPAQSAFFRGALWNLSSNGLLTKVDPQSRKVVTTANIVPVPCGLAAGEDALWVADCSSPAVVRVDPAHDVVIGRLTLPVPRTELFDATQSVATGAGSVWVGQGFDNPSYVWRLDPTTGRVQHRYTIPEGGAQAVVFAAGALWVGGGVIGRVSRIDPTTNDVTSPARDFGGRLCCLTAGGGYVWVAVDPGGEVWKLTARGDVVSSVTLGTPVAELSYADGSVWAATGESGRLVRIDATTDASRSYVVGHNVTDSTVHAGVLAVSVQPAGKDVTAGLTGKVVTLALANDDLDATSTDPLAVQSAFNPAQVQFHYATCAKLFNYPDAAGRRGQRLEPEVAAGQPTVTNGGRTYTFRIRSGFGFSPPSHEQVTAESFRHALERFLSPIARTFDPLDVLGDIVGANAYAAGRTRHVAGISARGNTLAISLVRPAGDLVARLALPSFCAVQAELPTVPHGLPYPIPSAGPYYLADRSSDVFVLRPNPNYHGRRPQRLDAIVYRVGIEPSSASTAIAAGRIDYTAGVYPVLSPDTMAARAAGLRYRLVANNWTDRLALNTARPVFSDGVVRRAVAYALDRRLLARSLTIGGFELPTSSLLPPNLRGTSRAHYSLTPDLGTARRLMRGRHAHVVFAAAADEAGKLYDPELARTLQRELAAIGIALRIDPLRQTLDPAHQAAVLAAADLTRVGSNADDARDPVAYLLHLPYLPAAEREKLTRIDRLPSPRRESAARAMAARLEREASYIGYGDGAAAQLVSRRLGCVVDQPEYPGLDLAALCLVH